MIFTDDVLMLLAHTFADFAIIAAHAPPFTDGISRWQVSTAVYFDFPLMRAAASIASVATGSVTGASARRPSRYLVATRDSKEGRGAISPRARLISEYRPAAVMWQIVAKIIYVISVRRSMPTFLNTVED